MTQTYFTIDCITNMHVGSGKANYGVIDQLVQRDPTYHYPSIHASSLKGGIKEYCHHTGFADMVSVFGSEKQAGGKTKHDTSQVGAYKFFDAMLLCMPLRCDKRTFIHITCPNIAGYLSDTLPLGSLLKKALDGLKDIFDKPENTSAFCFSADMDGATIEDFDIKATYDKTKAPLLTNELKALFRHEIVVVTDKIFDRLTNDLHLPVLARNYLENGESKNLWYEQVVPRLSRFWGMAIHPDQDVLFQDKLFGTDMVQIGANGSVGYGYCSFSKIN